MVTTKPTSISAAKVIARICTPLCFNLFLVFFDILFSPNYLIFICFVVISLSLRRTPVAGTFIFLYL